MSGAARTRIRQAGRAGVRFGTLVLALSCIAGPEARAAQGESAQPMTHEISREQAAQMLQERYGSSVRVVRSDVVDEGGRRLYVFRLLSVNGRVWIVHIDARSGSEVP